MSIPTILSGSTPYAIAHRGSRLLWPENTIFAMEQAANLGYCWFETDLHLTADEQIVCLHDPDLERTTNGSGPVAEISFAELQRLDAGYNHRLDGGFPFRGQGIQVPSLAQVWNRFPQANFILELKADGLEEHLVRFLDLTEGWDRVIFGSFSGRRLKAIRAASGGKAITSASTAEVFRTWVGSGFRRLGLSSCDLIQIPPRWRGIKLLTPRLVQKVHASGRQVHVWTINDPNEMNRILDMGVDAILSDRPDLLKTELQSRNSWNH